MRFPFWYRKYRERPLNVHRTQCCAWRTCANGSLQYPPFRLFRFYGIEVARGLFFGIEILHSVVQYRALSSRDQPVRAFLGLDILQIGGRIILIPKRRSKNLDTPKKTSWYQLKEHIHLAITGECSTHSLHSREYIHSIRAYIHSIRAYIHSIRANFRH